MSIKYDGHKKTSHSRLLYNKMSHQITSNVLLHVSVFVVVDAHAFEATARCQVLHHGGLADTRGALR